jgi:hypothetical protein
MKTLSKEKKTSPNQNANLILWGCVVFSVAYTALIYSLGPLLADTRAQLLSDQGVAWYYWKLPDPTFWSRATSWGFYLLHQLAVWGTIYYAQTGVKRYTSGLHPINVIALGINAFFALLHVVQTHVWYDGLAQDVSIFSSQGSVIVLLVWVLLMENSRRGMFFGYKLPLRQNIIQFARKYHGYFFAWAIVYTFWYHPTETTNGHLWGFFYTTLLLLQGSLFFTKAHVNKYWTFFLEFTVLAHGTLVAVQQGNGIWPMFFFGFGGIFIITQMHGLGLSRLVRGGLLAAYIAGALYVYNSRGWDKLNEIVRIPIIDYVAVLLLAGIFGSGLWIARLVRGKTAPAQASD